jgi:hypothetical protein
MNQKALDQISRFNARRFQAPVLEKDIQATVTQFLEWDGWRALRTDPVSDRGRAKGFGEPGMADHLYIRYQTRWRQPLTVGVQLAAAHVLTAAEVMWVEFKRRLPVKRGKAWGRATKASIHQQAWHAKERARGALTIILGEDCEASVEGFKRFYFASGLARRIQP